MDQKIYFAYRKFPFTVITLIIFTTSAKQVLALDPKFNACEPKSCGQGPNISYPFWLPQAQESFCGYPNFEISCKGESPVLAISNDDYIIKDIFYTNHSFLVANSAAYEDACPISLHNLSLDRTSFNISPGYTSLSFFYNCLSSPPNFTYPLTCASNYTHSSFASLDPEMLELYHNDVLETCEDVVNAPVDTGGDFGTLFTANYSDILKMGFLLSWTANNCSTCQTSGGRCGFENNQFVCFCRDQPRLQSCDVGAKVNIRWKVIVGVCTAVASVIIMCLICFFRKGEQNNEDVEAFIRNYGPLAPKRYTYSDVKKMTGFFKDKLGQGGYGGVYKGKLHDGRLVAVKVLKESKGNGEEFINEVASISRTSHVNIVTLLGYCFQADKRVLIYEFMPNGSLDKFMHNKKEFVEANRQHLGWKKLYEIAVGVARGLEYLHRGCNTRIVHFDIKPHNILLDENFSPKISDFGLAKLCNREESILSMLGARGTIGYIAPEVFSRYLGGVSHKSDVYSYGMMILEMAGGTEKNDSRVETEHTSDLYFPHWIYKRLELGNESEILGVSSAEDAEILQKMTLVGLWCIQTNPSPRPSMSKVIEMLEGSIDALTIPPKPFLSSPPRPPLHFSTTSSMTQRDE